MSAGLASTSNARLAGAEHRPAGGYSRRLVVVVVVVVVVVSGGGDVSSGMTDSLPVTLTRLPAFPLTRVWHFLWCHSHI